MALCVSRIEAPCKSGATSCAASLLTSTPHTATGAPLLPLSSRPKPALRPRRGQRNTRASSHPGVHYPPQRWDPAVDSTTYSTIVAANCRSLCRSSLKSQRYLPEMLLALLTGADSTSQSNVWAACDAYLSAYTLQRAHTHELPVNVWAACDAYLSAYSVRILTNTWPRALST
jgi:hypothetical protein